LAAMSLAVSAWGIAPSISYEPFQPMQFWAIVFGVMIFLSIFPRRSYRLLSRNVVALSLLFAVMPYIYAFGSGANYWAQSARAGIFWLLSGFALSAQLAGKEAVWRNLAPMAAVALVITTGVLYASMENPYRQTQPLRLQVAAVDVDGKSTLFLAAEAASYIRDLKKLATENGFKAGEPVLDLTGVSPGSVYLLGARAPGVAWTLAGYPGSKEYLTAALNDETCETIAALWILTEPGSETYFPPEALRKFGIDVANDYLEVGSIRSTREFAPRNFEHGLFRPTRSPAQAKIACEDARRK
jgi:hypothetical protein